MKKTTPALIATLLITTFLVAVMIMIGRDALGAGNLHAAAAFVPAISAFI